MWGFTNRATRLGEGRRFARNTTRGTGLARLTIRRTGEQAAIEIAGELDFSSVDAVAAAIVTTPHSITTIDLAGLEFLDVAGARMLLDVQRECARRDGCEPAIAGASASVQRVLTMVGDAAVRHAVYG